MADHLITTRPGLTVCGRCRVPVLAAVIGGLDRHVDPVALNREGVHQASRGGLAVFALRGDTLYRLPRTDVTADALTVMPEHICNRPVPDRFVSAAHMEAAIHLVTRLLGAQAVVTEDTPPY